MADTSLPELNALWDFQDPALSEVRFRELLSCAGVREDRGYLACLLTQLARSVGLQQRFEEARELLDQAEEVAPPEDGLARTRLLLERGRVANSSGDRAGSRPYFLAAWETAESAGLESLAVDAAHMLGIVEEPEQAMEWNYRAMERAEKSSDPAVRNWLGPLYNNTGWTRFERGELEAALVLFERGLVLREARGQPRETRIARWSVARVWRALGRVEPALAEQHALADACDAAGEPDGFVWEEIGECLLELGREQEARPALARAYQLLREDPWLARSEPERLTRLGSLGGEA